MSASTPSIKFLAGVLAVATLAVSACGSDSKSSAETPSGTNAPAATTAASAAASTGSTDAPSASADTTATTTPAAELPAPQLSLVAYPTPQAAYEQIIAPFN